MHVDRSTTSSLSPTTCCVLLHQQLYRCPPASAESTGSNSLFFILILKHRRTWMKDETHDKCPRLGEAVCGLTRGLTTRSPGRSLHVCHHPRCGHSRRIGQPKLLLPRAQASPVLSFRQKISAAQIRFIFGSLQTAFGA